MAALGRQSSFLPTIKCSSCGDQIEISMMGEHICGTGAPKEEASPPSPPPPPPPEKFDSFMPFNKTVHEKIGRVPPPPKVDTLVANRTYYRAGQLTPVSNSSGSASRSMSPLTPSGRSGTGRPDDYFAPKIANEYDSAPTQPQPRRPGGYGGLDGLDDQTSPVDSPKKQGPSLLQRMNTIAPGPFDANRRPSARNGPPSRASGQSELDDGMVGTPVNPYGERPRTSGSNAGFGGSQPPKLPRKNGYGGFGPPQRSQDEYEPEPLSAMNRAGTFPRVNQTSEAPLRTPSAPGPRPDRLRRPSNDADARMPMNFDRSRQPSIGLDTSRASPPRKSTGNRPPTRDDSAANVSLADDFGIGNPYHSPNPSMSSSASASSRPSQPSSQTSPARSFQSRPTRKPSDTSSFDNLMQDLQSSMDDMQSLDPPRRAPSQPRPVDASGSLRNSSANRRQDRRDDSAAARQRAPLASPKWDGPTERSDSRASRDRQDRRGPPSPRFASPERTRAPSRAGPRGQSRGREPVQNSRGNCKACGDAITGKSISSADGRLTGRYHKACFVCTTCRDPFPSSTFYVHGDKPYCEQHYHEMNGSLCRSCGAGIEGQYLEDEMEQKYHPRCFRCGDCRQILSDGYFEIGGRQYCEKDAWRRTQPMPQPPSRTGTPSNLGPGTRRGPPGGLPAGPKGFPANGGLPGRPFGAMTGSNRLAPGSRPRMEKRMTRLGMM